jgi:hypothetical protein
MKKYGYFLIISLYTIACKPALGELQFRSETIFVPQTISSPEVKVVFKTPIESADIDFLSKINRFNATLTKFKAVYPSYQTTINPKEICLTLFLTKTTMIIHGLDKSTGSSISISVLDEHIQNQASGTVTFQITQ